MDGLTAARFAAAAVERRMVMEDGDRAVVLLSGGQDSTTTFYYALREYTAGVAAVSFDYGQRHRVELEQALQTAKKNDVPLTLLPVEALSLLSAASLTNPMIGNAAPAPGLPEEAERNVYADARGLPASFVPGRNLLFFTLGAAWGLPRGYEVLVTGVCQQDRAGYPDCRAEFVDAIHAAIQAGMDAPGFAIDAPLLNRSKAETWALAAELGVLDEIVLNTRTCYEGDESVLHAWGYGCDRCGSCAERRRGFEEFKAGREAVAPA